MKILRILVNYKMFPHFGSMVVYPKRYETVRQLVTIRLRNKLKRQLDSTFHYDIVTAEYVELENIDIHRG